MRATPIADTARVAHNAGGAAKSGEGDSTNLENENTLLRKDIPTSTQLVIADLAKLSSDNAKGVGRRHCSGQGDRGRLRISSLIASADCVKQRLEAATKANAKFDKLKQGRRKFNAKVELANEDQDAAEITVRSTQPVSESPSPKKKSKTIESEWFSNETVRKLKFEEIISLQSDDTETNLCHGATGAKIILVTTSCFSARVGLERRQNMVADFAFFRMKFMMDLARSRTPIEFEMDRARNRTPVEFVMDFARSRTP